MRTTRKIATFTKNLGWALAVSTYMAQYGYNEHDNERAGGGRWSRWPDWYKLAYYYFCLKLPTTSLPLTCQVADSHCVPVIIYVAAFSYKAMPAQGSYTSVINVAAQSKIGLYARVAR